MSDVIDNNTEEETSSFGLGRGLDALFGDDEIMGLDDDEATEGKNDNEATHQGDDTADHMIDEIDTLIETMEGNVAQDEEPAQEPLARASEEDIDSEEDLDMAAAMAEETAQEEAQEPTHTPERKTLSDAADSLVSALERHIEETKGSEKSSETQSNRTRLTLPIENLHPSPFQPRNLFNMDSIQELASSIRQYGILQPLLVRKHSTIPDRYDIIAGERRWRASQIAQIHELPVIILDIDELEAYKIALIENLQREDIDPIDEAYGYQKLLEDFNQTQEQLAEAVGKSRPHITNMLRLLQLPTLAQAMVSERALSIGHARALIGVENADEIAQKVYKQGLSVRQTEKLAAAAKGKMQQKRPRSGGSAANTSTPAKDADTIALENDISNALGMAVTIDSADGKKGKLSVEFKSLDQLDEVLHRLAHFPGTRLSG